MLKRIYALIIKELLSVWRDKKSRMVLIFPPLTQLLLFAMAATLDVTNASVVVFNRDAGKASFELIQRIKGAPAFHNLSYVNTQDELQYAMDTQKALAAISIDEQFSRDYYAGKSAKVQLVLDGRKSNSAQIVQGYIGKIVADFAKEGSLEKIELVERNWFNPNLLYYWFNVPNLCGVLTMLICFLVTALSVSREKELGTFDQLLVSPLSPLEILIGKSIPAIFISLIEGSIIIAAGVFIFRVPFQGSLLTLYASLLVFICSIVGVGLFTSSIAKTQQQAILGSFLFISPALLLSGYATPVENMPEWLQTINVINPLRYFLVVVRGVFLKNMPASVVFDYTWPVAIIAIFTFSGAYLFFRKRIG